MWTTWRPGGPVLGDYPAYPRYGASDSGEVQPADRMMLEGMYQTGRRFSLAGWTADEWARFFESAAGSASQVYATVANRPIATQPVPVVRTPIGGVPTWAILGLVAVGGYFLLSARRR